MSSPFIDPARVPSTSSPPPLYRSLSVDACLLSKDLSQIDKTLDENELTELQLRELYDNEEIDRFLNLFSAYVTEVRVPETPQLDRNGSSVDLSSLARASEDSDWTPVRTSGEYFPPPVKTPASVTYKSLSEEIACCYLAPILPLRRPSAPAFTLGRLRLATQRLYLATLPVYGPFLSRLLSLATWEDSGTSLMYCSIYWTLWWYNMLAPALILRILFALVQRRIFPYPSLEDLRRHREEIMRADEFGHQVSARLSTSSSGMKEIWRLFKLFDRTKNRTKAAVKEKAKEKGVVDSSEQLDADIAQKDQDATVLDYSDRSDETRDIKRAALHLLDEIADVHERIRNIFIWRRPASSRKYGIGLFFILLVTSLPTKYIAKLVFFLLGFVYWHILPIIAALPSSDRERLAPLFDDVPTDADYAMELISQRVAAGLQVQPEKLQKNGKEKSSDSVSSTSRAEGGPKPKGSQSQGSENSVDWKKWGDRIAVGKSAVNDLRRLRPGSPWPVHEVWPPRHPIIPGAIGVAQPQSNVETHTYPCQHISSPGLITLTHTTLYFTPLTSQNAKLIVPLSAVKGVKKAGLLKGLHIQWNDPSDGGKGQKEEKFMWIGSRDELFARLIGTDGRRWMKV